MLKTFEQHLHLSSVELESSLTQLAGFFSNLPQVSSYWSSLNTELLRQTLPACKNCFSKLLPPFMTGA